MKILNKNLNSAVKTGLQQGARPAIQTAKPAVAANDRQRHIFENLKNKVRQNGGDVIVSEGFLRFERKITTSGIVEFLLKKGNDDNVTERRMDDNDSFLVTHLGLFLMKRDSTKPGVEVLQSYPNTEIFKDVAGEGEGAAPTFVGSDLEAIYNGALTLKVGQTVYIDGLDTLRFRNVPQTQGSDKTAAQIDSKTGFHEVTPQIQIDGSQSTNIRVEFPISGGLKIINTEANMTNYLVLLVRGFLVKNK